jgi:hypothetical protein
LWIFIFETNNIWGHKIYNIAWKTFKYKKNDSKLGLYCKNYMNAQNYKQKRMTLLFWNLEMPKV